MAFRPWAMITFDETLTALGGGVLIGLSATILLAMNGRVAGISGILEKVLPPQSEDAHCETRQVIDLLVILQLDSIEVVGTDSLARSMNPNRNRRAILQVNNHPTYHEFLPHPCLDR